MNKINFKHLDIPIIRSCNLACTGCLTHSNHAKIKGLVNLEDSRAWLEFWAKYLDPNAITVFGGEPLLHPELINWVIYLRNLWGVKPQLKINTNGYYLDKLINNIELFDESIALSPVVSIQTADEPYLSQVTRLVTELKDKIFEYRSRKPGVKTINWVLTSDEFDKKWYQLEVNGTMTNTNFVICEMYKLPWCTHFEGHGETMLPVYHYDDEHFEENHKWCQARYFVTLYQGALYKCPPMGVLQHTLDTFNLSDKPVWESYVKDYKKLEFESTEEQIINWFNVQDTPEKVCNMCGFSGPKSKGQQNITRYHSLKNNWKYPIHTS